MKPTTIVLVLLGVAGAGGGAYFLLRRRSDASKQGARDLGAAQATMGGKAVQMGVPSFISDQMGGRGVALAASAVQKKGGSASPSYVNQALGLGGAVADILYPGVGTKAANVLKAVDGKLGSLASKVPGVSLAKSAVSKGLSKLKFW